MQKDFGTKGPNDMVESGESGFFYQGNNNMHAVNQTNQESFNVSGFQNGFDQRVNHLSNQPEEPADLRQRFISTQPEGPANTRQSLMSTQPEGPANTRQSFMSTQPEGPAGRRQGVVSNQPLEAADFKQRVMLQQPGRPVKKRKENSSDTGKRHGGVKLVAAALIFGVVAGSSFYGVNRLLGRGSNKAVQPEVNTISAIEKSDNVGVQTMSDTSKTSQTLNYDVAKIAAEVQPSIVSITTTSTTTYQYYFRSIEQEVPGAGSGIIIGKNDKQLFIATNYHVIKDATSINIGFNDGEVVKASVKGYDESADIAVVTVNFDDMKESTAKAIKVAAVGSSDDLVVGEPVIAIGNALGYGQSVTVGYISALERKVDGFDGSLIQTDAAINPGNSGGALVNSKGQVIGINSAKYVDNTVEGMGFSIPSSRAMDIITNIINGVNGKVYLGISGGDINKEYSQIYGIPTGIYISDVENGSPAKEAGLQEGDIIVEFNGNEVYTVEDLQKLIAAQKEGDSVKIVVYRQNDMGQYNEMEINAVLGYTVTGH